MMRDSSVLPVIALLFAATLWGVFWYPLRLLESSGLVGLWAALLIFLGTLPVGIPLAWRVRRYFYSHGYLLLALGLAQGWCNVTFFLAVLEGNILRVMLLFYLSPLWAVILSKLFLREYITPRSYWLLLVAMMGAVIMLWDPNIGWPWPEGRADWLAISSGFAFALGNVLARKGAQVSVRAKTAASWVGAIVIALVWLVMAATPLPVVDHEVIVATLALGLFGMVIMSLLVLYGVSHLPVHRSAVILLFEIVIAAISAQLLTDEVVQLREWVGGVLIIFAAWLSV